MWGVRALRVLIKPHSTGDTPAQGEFPAFPSDSESCHNLRLDCMLSSDCMFSSDCSGSLSRHTHFLKRSHSFPLCQFGFCGGDPAHCGSNCVPGNSYNKNCTTPAPVCGAASSTKASCPLATAPCCSKAGYCGGSAAECTPDCQSAYSYNQTCSLPATCGPTEGSCPEAFYW